MRGMWQCTETNIWRMGANVSRMPASLHGASIDAKNFDDADGQMPTHSSLVIRLSEGGIDEDAASRDRSTYPTHMS